MNQQSSQIEQTSIEKIQTQNKSAHQKIIEILLPVLFGVEICFQIVIFMSGLLHFDGGMSWQEETKSLTLSYLFFTGTLLSFILLVWVGIKKIDIYKTKLYLVVFSFLFMPIIYGFVFNNLFNNLNKRYNCERVIYTSLKNNDYKATTFLSYKNQEYKYTVSYPKQWSYTERPGGLAVGFDKKENINQLDLNVTAYAISIYIIKNTKNTALDFWLEDNYPGVSFNDKKFIKVGGYDAVQTSAVPMGVKKIIETHIKKDNQIFIIRLLGKPVINDEERYYYDEMLRTFNFLD